MIPKNSIKPLELVVSAIHCLREKNGSSPQKIVRYLEGKYNVDTELLKPHVQLGLKRGLSFGLITQKSGLYRLNDILSSPNGSSYSDISSLSSKRGRKHSKGSKKTKVKKLSSKKGRRLSKQATSIPQKQGKRTKMSRRRRRVTRNSRRSKPDSEIKRPRRKRKSISGRRMTRADKKRKIKPEIQALRCELNEEEQNPTASDKEGEPQKTKSENIV